MSGRRAGGLVFLAAGVYGLAFGALSHFWVASGNVLYEIGGGDSIQYFE